MVWLLYLGLVVMRWRFAQGGRRFAFSAIGSFVFVLLTFWGTNVLSPLHNSMNRLRVTSLANRVPDGPRHPPALTRHALRLTPLGFRHFRLRTS